MKIKAYKSFYRFYHRLPKNVQVKVNKQIGLLAKNLHYLSLHTKRIKGTKIWEARIDIRYRRTFEIMGDVIFLRVVGNHGEVLRRP